MTGSSLPHLNLHGTGASLSISRWFVKEVSKSLVSGENQSGTSEIRRTPGPFLVFEEEIFLRRACGDTITIDAKMVGSAVRVRARVDDASCGALRDRDNGGVIFVRSSRNGATIHGRSQNQRCAERLSQGQSPAACRRTGTAGHDRNAPSRALRIRR